MIRQPGSKRKKIFVWCVAGVLILAGIASLAGFYLLKRGIGAERLTIGTVTISDSHLVWNERLEFQADTLSIGEDNTGSAPLFSREGFAKTAWTAHLISRFVGRITVGSMKIGDQQLSLDLLRQQDASFRLNLATDTTTCVATITTEPRQARVIVESVSDTRFDLDLSGTLQLDARDATVSGAFVADIEKSFPVQLSFTSDGRSASFRGAEAGIISEIRPLVDLFGLEDNIQKWITTYLSASRYHLLSFQGEYVFGEPMSLFQSFEAEIMVDDVSYSFEPGLEPVYDDHPRAFFKNGVLDIRPRNPVFSGHDAGASHLDINFNDADNPILSIYIDAETAADAKIIDLLRHYEIDLPFLQVKGETKADLLLTINLETEEVSGEGSFSIDDAVIAYEGAEFGVKNSRFSLKDSEVLLEHIEVSREELFAASISGLVLADRDIWDLEIEIDQLSFSLGASTVSLDNSVLRPMLGYHVSPEGNFLEAGESAWKLDSTAVRLGPFTAPVDLDDLSAQIHKVSLAMLPDIVAEVSGSFSIKKETADFNCELLNYHVKDLKLEQPKVPFRIRYLDGLIITAKETAQWSLGNVPVTLYPSEYRYADNLLTFVSGSFSYGNFFTSSFTGDFDMVTREGSLFLSKIDITHDRLATEIEVGDRTLVEVGEKEGTFVIDFKEFDLKITSDAERNWSAEFADLAKIHHRSELLRKLKISSGRVSISSVNGNMPYDFTADISAPYPLLVAEETISDRLKIKGKLSQGGLSATVNDTVKVHYFEDFLDIRTRDVGFNVTGVRELMADISALSEAEEEEAEARFKINLYAEKSYLYLSPGSRAVADSISLDYAGNELSMVLKHGEGLLELERIGGIYFVNGENLNDAFMEALLQGAYVEGGSLALAGMGADDEISAVIEIEDTVMKDLKTLNNTMALLNTLPALVTFSMPEYEMKGLPVQSAIVGLKYSDDRVVFETIDVDSPVVQAAGKGWMDMSNRTIDMDIQLTSQAGMNLRKIPIVGYVVAGKSEDTSVTLKIAGDLDNPEVSNSILKEIVTMPIDMLYRTLNLPFHLVNKLGPFTDDDSSAPAVESEAELQESDK